MERLTLANGRIVRKKDKEHSSFQMDQSIKVILRMTNLMEKGPKYSQMGAHTQGNFSLECFMARESLNKLVIVQNTKVIGGKIK